MLEPQVVVNLLPKLGIGVDLVRHGDVKDSRMPRECSANASAECSIRDGVATTCKQPGEHAWKGWTVIFAVRTALSRFEHFFALTFQ
jgi:hypothetical protein